MASGGCRRCLKNRPLPGERPRLFQLGPGTVLGGRYRIVALVGGGRQTCLMQFGITANSVRQATQDLLTIPGETSAVHDQRVAGDVPALIAG